MVALKEVLRFQVQAIIKLLWLFTFTRFHCHLSNSYLVLTNLSENRNTAYGPLKWVGPCKLEMCTEIHKTEFHAQRQI
jgi:hypothetical protein